MSDGGVLSDYFPSERYPLTSQLIQENKIPEFGELVCPLTSPLSSFSTGSDNLYIDFNGIIHNCESTPPHPGPPFG